MGISDKEAIQIELIQSTSVDNASQGGISVLPFAWDLTTLAAKRVSEQLRWFGWQRNEFRSSDFDRLAHDCPFFRARRVAKGIWGH